MRYTATILAMILSVGGAGPATDEHIILDFSDANNVLSSLVTTFNYDITWTYDDGTELRIDPNGLLIDCDPNHVTDKVIMKLCKSGRVCKARGHIWQDNNIGWVSAASLGQSCAVYHGLGEICSWNVPPPPSRTCQICGITQTQVTIWHSNE